MSDVLQFPEKPEVDSIEEMKGPARWGHDVFVDGHVIPHMIMVDKGDVVELTLDNRMTWIFPREIAPMAASFAATAMAIGAGHPHFSAPHEILKAFATPIKRLDSLPL